MKKTILVLATFLLIGASCASGTLNRNQVGNLPTNGQKNENSNTATEPTKIEKENANKCLVGGGEWKVLPDSCGDACTKGVCTFFPEPGCDCGADKCWDGQTCRNNLKGDELGYCTLKDYANSPDKNNPKEVKISLGQRTCSNKSTAECKSFCTANQDCTDYRGEPSSYLENGICQCNCFFIQTY